MNKPYPDSTQANALLLKEMAESLRYAATIQQALFPSPIQIKRWFSEYFLLFRPCQAVSGDFYHVSGRQDHAWIAVGDSTGHGVPGALMSILGLTTLNNIITRNPAFRPAQVLNCLREHVMLALGQTGSPKDQHDGIDISLCRLNLKDHILEFAGAFSPIYHVSRDLLREIPGDSMPVGIGSEQERSFTETRIQLFDGDMVYLFSDGYSDQFGGPEGKKYKYKQFRKLLASLAVLPVAEQKARAEREFLDWIGKQRQIDDVTLFGFRYHMSKTN
jgi:serine phosphatase RsbU (regulator of sigma subunit)